MQALKFSGLVLCSLCFMVKGDAQSQEPTEKPVWAMEFLEAHPGKKALALGYLDDHWMRVREEAKRQGVVLNYQRFSEVGLVFVDLTGASKAGDPNSIVLLTEYKNVNAFVGREAAFASILRHLPSATPGVVPLRPEELYETVETRVFVEQPANPDTAQFKLVGKK
ncbi:MAG TPA: hypothetical protein VHM93_10620 [Candidatus Acidoferrum sp.]|jgi:hypothetical protein|nr:hypothetical protein [Candidatus Acidoferrum sp.]